MAALARLSRALASTPISSQLHHRLFIRRDISAEAAASAPPTTPEPPNVILAGQVTVYDRHSVLNGDVLRRDLNKISVGICANVQERSVVHAAWNSTTVRNFCSRNCTDDSEVEDEDDDDEEEDFESEVEGNVEDDDRENVDAGKTDEEKAKEAVEIGYKVIGPLQKSDRVYKSYQPVFAVVQIGSHQFKVSNDDSIFTEKLKYCDVNDKIILNKVLMLGSATQTLIGRPVLVQASVHAVVEEHALDAKVIIFKKKRRKNYRRTKGHRQELTKLRITEIRGIGKPKTNPSLKTTTTEDTPNKQDKVPVAV